MKTYNCFYVECIDGESSRRENKIDAESPREAYDAFLAKEGIYQITVQVDPSGVFSVSEVFRDHIGNPEAKESQRKAKEEQHEIEEATANALSKARSSLSSNDMLLSELIAKQDETNQLLRKIWWVLVSIGIILAIWNIRVFG
jgi:hypothetical protein